MYYFFNESTATETRTATLAGHGKAQELGPGHGRDPSHIGYYRGREIR
jgi:hypothetical protein